MDNVKRSYRIVPAPGVKAFFMRLRSRFWAKDGYFTDALWIFENACPLVTKHYAKNNLLRNGWKVQETSITN